MLDPITAEIAHIAVHVAEGHRASQVQIQVVDGDLIQLSGPGRQAALQFDVAEEIAQVQVVFIRSFLGMSLDGLMVDQKVPQQLGRIQFIVISVHSLPPTQQNFYFVE